MLKITGQRDVVQQRVSIILEGRLMGPWVEELKGYCRDLSANQQSCTMVDLTDVTFIDAKGKALLSDLWRQGVELRASGCLTKCVVEEITAAGRTDGL